MCNENELSLWYTVIGVKDSWVMSYLWTDQHSYCLGILIWVHIYKSINFFLYNWVSYQSPSPSPASWPPMAAVSLVEVSEDVKMTNTPANQAVMQTPITLAIGMKHRHSAISDVEVLYHFKQFSCHVLYTWVVWPKLKLCPMSQSTFGSFSGPVRALGVCATSSMHHIRQVAKCKILSTWSQVTSMAKLNKMIQQPLCHPNTIIMAIWATPQVLWLCMVSRINLETSQMRSGTWWVGKRLV